MFFVKDYPLGVIIIRLSKQFTRQVHDHVGGVILHRGHISKRDRSCEFLLFPGHVRQVTLIRNLEVSKKNSNRSRDDVQV